MHEIGGGRAFRWNTVAVLCLLLFSSPTYGASLSPRHVERDISLPVTSTVDYDLLQVFAENGNGSLRDEIATERLYLFEDTSWERGKYTGPSEFVVLFFGSAAIPQVTYPRGRIDLFVDGRPFSIHLPEFTAGNGKFFFALYVGDDGSTYYANYVKDTTFGGGVAHDLLDQAFKLTPEEAFTREYLAAEGATITVGNGPGYDFQKIEAAIWHCPYGGEVVVAPGTYYEHNIIMKEGVTLRSQVRHCATIDGEGAYSLIHMNNNSRIDGFILTHGNEGIQPLFGAAGGFEVRNCIVKDNSRTGVRGGDDLHLGIYNTVVSRNGFYGIILPRGEIVSSCIANNAYAGVWVESGTVLVTNSTIVANEIKGEDYPYDGGSLIMKNCVMWHPGKPGPITRCEVTHSRVDAGTPGEGNVYSDPLFSNGLKGDFRLRADSPCIDAGVNGPDLPEFDIAGMRRIMFGGKSPTVDMGAHEFYINRLSSGPEPVQTILAWSSLADRTYSLFYTDDLFTWHLVIDNFPSAGNQTTSWTDDGSLTGVPPSLAPKRFYRILENP